MKTEDIKSTIVIDVVGKTNQLKDSLNEIKSGLNKLKISGNLSDNIESIFDELEDKFEKLQKLTKDNKLSVVDDKAAQKAKKQILDLFDDLEKKIGSSGLAEAPLKADLKVINALKAALKGYGAEFKKQKATILSNRPDLTEKGEKLTTERERAKNELDLVKDTKSYKRYRLLIDNIEEYKLKLEEAKKAEEGWAQKNKGKSWDEYQQSSRGAYKNTNVYKQYEEIRKQLEETFTPENQKFAAIDEAYKNATDALRQYNDELEVLASKQAIQSIKEAPDFKGAGINPDTIQSYDDLEDALKEISETAGENGARALEELKQKFEESKPPVKELGDALDKSSDDLQEMVESRKEIDNLKQSLVSFFSITNSVNLFRRAISSAYNTIKELDAAMTEMAVVTDLDIGDYWEQLPEYTKRAKELGLTIKDVYESMTLFYQQGIIKI